MQAESRLCDFADAQILPAYELAEKPYSELCGRSAADGKACDVLLTRSVFHTIVLSDYYKIVATARNLLFKTGDTESSGGQTAYAESELRLMDCV